MDFIIVAGTVTGRWSGRLLNVRDVASRKPAACPLRPDWLDKLYERTGYKRILLEEKTEHGATIRRAKIVPLSQAGDP